MDEPRLIITYGGNWDDLDRTIYRGGFSEILVVPTNLSFKTLLGLVHKIVRVDLNIFAYELRSLLIPKILGSVIGFKIENDRHLQHLLKVGNGISEIFVTVKQCQQHVNHSINGQLLNKSNHQSFVQLMASQCALASGCNYMHASLPFFEQKRCSEMASGQHIRIETEIRPIPQYGNTLVGSTTPHMHYRGSHHQASEPKMKEKETMRLDEINKRIALSNSPTSSTGSTNSTTIKKMAKKAAPEMLGEKTRKHNLRNENHDMLLRQNDVQNATPDFCQVHSFPTNEASAGGKHDCHGKWYKDEIVVLDSDEENSNTSL
ncbi:hypothetical protein PTKIN_Ptkin10aG0135400 [Pterospermum kingtungense]